MKDLQGKLKIKDGSLFLKKWMRAFLIKKDHQNNAESIILILLKFGVKEQTY